MKCNLVGVQLELNQLSQLQVLLVISEMKCSVEAINLVNTYALYLMEGYSPRVEQRVAICSAIFSMPALLSEALRGL